jgi:hypothetical protein
MKAILLCGVLGLSSCVGTPRPDPIYDKVFTEYERRDIERELASDGTLAAACRGDSQAIHKIFEGSMTWGREGGERSEGCIISTLALMFHLGDSAFASALGRESKETREAVGRSIDHSMVYHRLSYPLTRAVYEYRDTSGS